jgi:hypothetical protein
LAIIGIEEDRETRDGPVFHLGPTFKGVVKSIEAAQSCEAPAVARKGFGGRAIEESIIAVLSLSPGMRDRGVESIGIKSYCI